jgi:hypothetical protein
VETEHKRISLDGVLYREGEYFVAHCLQLDIVGTSKESEEDAVNEMMDLCEEQIIDAFATNNLDHLLKAAPREVWEKFWDNESPKRRSVTRTISLQKPSSDHKNRELRFRFSELLVSSDALTD